MASRNLCLISLNYDSGPYPGACLSLFWQNFKLLTPDSAQVASPFSVSSSLLLGQESGIPCLVHLWREQSSDSLVTVVVPQLLPHTQAASTVFSSPLSWSLVPLDHLQLRAGLGWGVEEWMDGGSCVYWRGGRGYLQCLLFNKGVSGHFSQISFFTFRESTCLLRLDLLGGGYRGQLGHLPWRKMAGCSVPQSPLGAAMFLLLPPAPAPHPRPGIQWPPLSLRAAVIKSSLATERMNSFTPSLWLNKKLLSKGLKTKGLMTLFDI